MSSIFLSHNHNDKPFVNELARYLTDYGITVWVDQAEIKIGESLLEKVSTGIFESAFIGVVLSKNSINSEWVARELRMAMDKELKERRNLVLPIVLYEGALPDFLRDRLYADFSKANKYYTELAKLLSVLGAVQRPGPRVYVSYTHDSEGHKKWVSQLVERLALDGVNVTYDYAFMDAGTDFWASIEQELDRANAAILICTQGYKHKAEGHIPGGLKREFDYIVQQAAERPSFRVIPIAAGDAWEWSVPDVFASRFGVYMTPGSPDEAAYENLISMIRKAALA